VGGVLYVLYILYLYNIIMYTAAMGEERIEFLIISIGDAAGRSGGGGGGWPTGTYDCRVRSHHYGTVSTVIVRKSGPSFNSTVY